MNQESILIVDDEKNILLTVSQALSSLDCEISTAASGEDALGVVEEKEISLMLLDLRLPGIDGMEVLRKVAALRPEVKVIILTAYGAVENAVEAMKLGAVDFIQKPFSPREIRELVSNVLDRKKIEETKDADYKVRIELTKRCINERRFQAALEQAKMAVGRDPSRPEAFNLLGALHEVMGDRLEAQKKYRVALELDPTYKPARQNLERTTGYETRGRRLDLG